MMSTITTGLRTFHHRREAGAVSGAAATPTPLTITATKTITTITDMTTTTTEAATTTRTTAMTTTRGPAEDEGAESAAAPVRPGAVATSRHGAGWASPRGEALEQAAEVNESPSVAVETCSAGCSETQLFLFHTTAALWNVVWPNFFHLAFFFSLVFFIFFIENSSRFF